MFAIKEREACINRVLVNTFERETTAGNTRDIKEATTVVKVAGLFYDLNVLTVISALCLLPISRKELLELRLLPAEMLVLMQ